MEFYQDLLYFLPSQNGNNFTFWLVGLMCNQNKALSWSLIIEQCTSPPICLEFKLQGE